MIKVPFTYILYNICRNIDTILLGIFLYFLKLFHSLDVKNMNVQSCFKIQVSRKGVFMDIEKFKELVNTNSNFEKIREELWDFVDDVGNIDYDVLDTELNEVISANLHGMDIRDVSDLEIKNSSFECVVKVVGHIDIEDEGYEEEISDSVEILFNVAVLGIIEDDEVVIEEIERIEQL